MDVEKQSRKCQWQQKGEVAVSHCLPDELHEDKYKELPFTPHITLYKTLHSTPLSTLQLLSYSKFPLNNFNVQEDKQKLLRDLTKFPMEDKLEDHNSSPDCNGPNKSCPIKTTRRGLEEPVGISQDTKFQCEHLATSQLQRQGECICVKIYINTNFFIRIFLSYSSNSILSFSASYWYPHWSFIKQTIFSLSPIMYYCVLLIENQILESCMNLQAHVLFLPYILSLQNRNDTFFQS